MEIQNMETPKMEKPKYAKQLKYFSTEKGRQKHNECKRRYYANHPEYREKQLILKQKYRKLEKELKEEFKRLSAITC